MMLNTKPLPPLLTATDTTSFAYTTITQRLPAIARRVLAENNLPAIAVRRVDVLIKNIWQGTVQWFSDDCGPDVRSWARYAAPFLGQRWTEIPCTFAETYFYRSMLAATGYFRPEPGYHHDPYGEQKRLGVLTTLATIQAMASRLNAVRGWSRGDALSFIYGALWGNRADLCLWPIDATDGAPRQLAEPAASPYLLVDEAPRLADRLAAMRAARVDIVADNAGFELVCDLGLADYLLITGRAATVELHLKNHPTFVSDAMPVDVRRTLSLLAEQHHPALQAMVQRLHDHLASGRLRLRADSFWTSPMVFSEMPAYLSRQLAGSAMVLVKGDMNYRRLLGDRLWPFTTPFDEIVSYFPAPLTALRTIKAELGAGFAPAQVRMVSAQDPEWLRNGRWGVIQLAEPFRMTLSAANRLAVQEMA